MSYCRFTNGDVYAYECEGGVQFWTTDRTLDRLCRTFVEAYRYAVSLHDDHGLCVPDYAIDLLRADAEEEIGRVACPNGPVAVPCDPGMCQCQPVTG